MTDTFPYLLLDLKCRFLTAYLLGLGGKKKIARYP